MHLFKKFKNGEKRGYLKTNANVQYLQVIDFMIF